MQFEVDYVILSGHCSIRKGPLRHWPEKIVLQKYYALANVAILYNAFLFHLYFLILRMTFSIFLPVYKMPPVTCML